MKHECLGVITDVRDDRSGKQHPNFKLFEEYPLVDVDWDRCRLLTTTDRNNPCILRLDQCALPRTQFRIKQESKEDIIRGRLAAIEKEA